MIDLTVVYLILSDGDVTVSQNRGDETHKTRDDNMQGKERSWPARKTEQRALSNNESEATPFVSLRVSICEKQPKRSVKLDEEKSKVLKPQSVELVCVLSQKTVAVDNQIRPVEREQPMK
ncbi:hypothetical protein FPOAC1_001367 [Fusarium poae]|uniref:hypothetical protein n=1 Tax=Fusarium poae TaxID=36050 RepID=UPI001CEAF88D|nr:hypothetical protein FPOAC1_001367 [Fusarium poae]KAG8675389.1 hypothetical protein FPOAC1_001367 [Fusarium poae]